MGELEIRHEVAVGTVLVGTCREDGVGVILRPLGWRWSPSAGVWVMADSREKAADLVGVRASVRALAGAGLTVRVVVGEDLVDPRQRWRRVAERERRRAQRLRVRSAREQAAGDADQRRYEQLAQQIPVGQPLLVDAAGYSRQLRAAARRDRHAQLALRHQRAAAAAQAGAERADRADVLRHSPGMVARRLERLTALARRLDRQIAEASGTPSEWLADARRRRGQLGAEVAYWQSVRQEQLTAGEILRLGPDVVAPGDQVEVAGRWWPVVRVNRASVTVDSGTREHRVAWSSIRDHQPVGR